MKPYKIKKNHFETYKQMERWTDICRLSRSYNYIFYYFRKRLAEEGNYQPPKQLKDEKVFYFGFKFRN